MTTRDRPFEPVDYGLYALTVIAWSASWFAIELQVGSGMSNEVNLVWRFAIATLLMFAWAAFSGRRLGFPITDHLRFAVLGILIFSSNFLFSIMAPAISSAACSRSSSRSPRSSTCCSVPWSSASARRRAFSPAASSASPA
ncbi:MULTISPECIES: EamA family transporter [unclassified Mesorhizobium]|uniref:EamA family transporter n=1 Tax=unclassified Mesorhizobium TaxID=325217 RepID=UPI003334D78D